MARSKKVADTPTLTAPKTRGIDLQEVEARVTALDKAKRRSYDIFDIEQRVYNLEKNGGGGSSSPVKFDSGTFTLSADVQGTVDVSLENIKGIADFIVVEFTIGTKKMAADFSKFNYDLSEQHYFCSRYISPDDFLNINVAYGATTGYPAIVGVADGKFTFKSGASGYTGVVATYKAYKYSGA